MSVKTITVHELHALKAAGRPVTLIDVRTPEEFVEILAASAENVPLDAFQPDLSLTGRVTASAPAYIICRSGGRSEMACEISMAAGFENVVNVEGGTLAWVEAGFPTEQGPS